MPGSDRILETFVSLRGRISRLVMGIVPPKEVEDIVQETYVRLCQVENVDAISRAAVFSLSHCAESGAGSRQAFGDPADGGDR